MSRFWALVSVLALFLAGVSIGALGMLLLQERGPRGWHRPFFGPPSHRLGRYLADRLDLTAEQREKIAQIQKNSWRESESLRRELRPQIERQMQKTHEQILAVLTPQQREKLDTLLREEPHLLHHLFMGEGERHHGAPPGPPPEEGPPPPPPSE